MVLNSVFFAADLLQEVIMFLLIPVVIAWLAGIAVVDNLHHLKWQYRDHMRQLQWDAWNEQWMLEQDIHEQHLN